MAGHSKWAQTKHKKAVVDQRRGKLFAKLLRGIEVAAREGGGNPEASPTLADAISRARDGRIPSETIERAIKRGTGELEGVSYETLFYEGYALGGVAVIVEVLTDNRNRAAAAVRKIFSRHGGTLGDPGSVAWMFAKRGVVLVPRTAVSEDDLLALALAAGAEDLEAEGDSWVLTCSPSELIHLREAIEAADVEIQAAQIAMEPSATIRLDGPQALQVLRLIDELEESDDVQEVHANFDIPEEVMAEVGG